MFADFFWIPADFTVQEFDWDTGVGGTGVLVDEWAGYEGGLQIRESSRKCNLFLSTFAILPPMPW